MPTLPEAGLRTRRRSWNLPYAGFLILESWNVARMCADQPLPLLLVPLLVGHSLAVGAERHHDRHGIGVRGSKHVRPEDRAVVHGDTDVPLYQHEAQYPRLTTH